MTDDEMKIEQDFIKSLVKEYRKNNQKIVDIQKEINNTITGRLVNATGDMHGTHGGTDGDEYLH